MEQDGVQVAISSGKVVYDSMGRTWRDVLVYNKITVPGEPVCIVWHLMTVA
ncbi:MAG: hypothetical protein ACLTZT_12630 [Butyricimonas faecalis]